MNLTEKDIESEFGSYAGDSRLAEALWVCSSMFGNLSVKVGSKRIFLFTNEDNPYGGKDDMAKKAKQRARDVADNSIEIEPFFFNRAAEQRFDLRLFYKDILTLDEEGDDEYMANLSDQFNVSLRFDQLKAKVLRKAFKKRSQGRISFFIGNGTQAGDFSYFFSF
jgi:ATP-dependent DNA helicase 2 subunit 1